MAAEDIVMKMGLDASKFNADAKGAMGSLGGITAGVAALGVAFQQTLKLMNEYASAFREQMVSERGLQIVLRNTNSAMGLERFKAFASARQAVTNFGDEVTISAAKVLAPLNITAKQFEQLTVGAQDMATAAGSSLPSAMRDMSRAIGNASISGPLKRFVGTMTEAQIATFKAANESERAAFLVEKLGRSISGMAEAAVDPQVQFNGAMGDFKEIIGEMIIDEHDQFYRDLTSAVGNLAAVVGSTENQDALRTFGALLRGIVAPLVMAAEQVRGLAEAAGAATLGEGLQKLAKISARTFAAATTLGATEFFGVFDEPIDGGPVVTQLPPSGFDYAGTYTGVAPKPKPKPRTGTGTQARGASLSGFGDSAIAGERGDISDPFQLMAAGDGDGFFEKLLGVNRAVIETSPIADLEPQISAAATAWGTFESAGTSALSSLGASVANLGAEITAALILGQTDGLDKMIGKFLESTGKQLVASGIMHAFTGAAMLLTGNPAGAGLLGVAAGEGIAGAAMIGGSIPFGAGASAAASGGAGLGGASGAANGGGGGNGGGGIIINNSYGAVGPSPQEQARELGRIFRAANRSGIVIQGA